MGRSLIYCLIFVSLSTKSYSQVTNVQYDSRGQIIRIQYPDSSVISYVYDNNGNLITKRTSDPCSTKPKPVITPLTPLVVCDGDTVKLTTDIGEKYAWSNGDTTQQISITQSGKYAITRLDTFGVYEDTLQCYLTSDSIEVTVKPLPNLSPITDQAICNGDTTNNITFSSDLPNTSYSWAGTNSTIGLAANGNGHISSFTVLNTGNTPIIDTITVTPAANGCAGAVQVFTITANPIPDVNTTNDQILCNKETTQPITFSGSVSSAIYNWVNSDTSIGLKSNDTGDIAAFVARNTLNILVTSVVEVTPTFEGCIGQADTFSITVKPTPLVDTITSQVLCNGDTTLLISFTGNVSGGIFDWTHNYPSIGLSKTGTGNIAAFKAVNASFIPIVDTVSVIASANGCTGPPEEFTFTVNPTPNIQPTSDTAYCNGVQTNLIPFKGSVQGSTFEWSNDNTFIGLSPNGTGDILPFTASNPSDSQYHATITVTPKANDCVGVSDSFIITTNPIPRVYTIADQTYCNNELTDSINFIGTVTNTSFNWTSSNTSIGLPAIGIGNILPFEIKNSGTVQTQSTIVVTPEANNCIGLSKAFVIKVNPTLVPDISITVQEGTEICAGARATFIAITEHEGTNPSYDWTINGINQGKHSYSFSTLALKNGDVVRCELTSNAICADPVKVQSNEISMTVNPNLIPTVSISIEPGSNVGMWKTIKFNTTIEHGGVNPEFIWYRNGNEQIGYNNSYYEGKVGVDLIDDDSMCVKIVSNERCLAIDTATNCSKKINITDFYEVGVFDHVTLFPNPNEGSFKLVGNIYTKQEIKLEVMDASGKNIYNSAFVPKTNTVNEEIQLSELSNGVYFLKLALNEESRSLRFVIRR